MPSDRPPTPFLRPVSPGRATSVLAIDDHGPNLRLLQRVFGRQGDVRFLSATTAREGHDLACRERPDLILLDLNLPDEHGTELLGRLQRDERTWTIPVIMLSGEHDPHQIERLLEAGAVAYLTKPFDLRQLLETVARVLESGR